MKSTKSQSLPMQKSLSMERASPSTLEWIWSKLHSRAIPLATVIVAWLVIRLLRNRSEASLQNEAFATGYSLATICVFLMLLGVRKRLVAAPLGRIAVWQQTHQYLGILSVGVYALHARWVTTGWLESMLAISFWSIALSGFVTWYVNRTSPRLLRAAGPTTLRQDVPERLKSIAQRAHTTALAAAGHNDTSALAEYHQRVLSDFFANGRGLLYRLHPNGTKRRSLISELENLDRYLSEAGREYRREMSQLVRQKDDLDFQSTIQNRIRIWASAHTWLLGAFVVLTIAHVLTVHQFVSKW
jgi:hypothetical protein